MECVCARDSVCTLGKGVPFLCVYLPLVSAWGRAPNRRSGHMWRTLGEVPVEISGSVTAWTGNESSGGRVSSVVLGRAAGAHLASACPQGLSAAASCGAPVACGPWSARLPLHLKPAAVHVALQPQCLPDSGQRVTCGGAGPARAGLRTASLVWALGNAAGCRAVPSPTPGRCGVCQREHCFWGDDNVSDSTWSVGDTGSWQNWSHPFGAVFGPERPKH